MEKEKKKRGRPKKTTPSMPLKPYTLILDTESTITIEKAAERSGQSKQEWCRETLLRAARKVLTGKQEVAAPKDNFDILTLVLEKIEQSNAPLLEEMNKLREEVNKPFLQKLFRK
jgi:uncharacterized protein (DUF1778 family)